MADGGRVLGERRYVEAAGKAASFVLERMRATDGTVLRVARGGTARIPGFLEDQACVAHALLALHRADGDARWLASAKSIVAAARSAFGDRRGAWFDVREGQEDLFVRTRSLSDGAVPSGSSVMLHVLLDLAAIEPTGPWAQEAAMAMGALSGKIADDPVGASLATLAVERLRAVDPSLLPKGEAAAAPRAAAVDVRVSADPAEITLADAPVTLVVRLELPDGVHVNAHEPGDAALVGLSVALLDGDGIELRVNYPNGEKGPGGTSVHRGAITIPVELKRSGSGSGRPAILVTYQPCTDRECLRPVTRAVPVTIRR
jgi:hypothetical protein